MQILIYSQGPEWGFALTKDGKTPAAWNTLTLEQRDDLLMMMQGCYTFLNEHLTDPVVHPKPTEDE